MTRAATYAVGIIALTLAVACGDPALSDYRIAFVSDRDGNDEIYVMNADGTGQTRLTGDGGCCPAWAPDGWRIAFIHRRDTDYYRDTDIYVMNADGSDQTLLTDNDVRDSYPSWSPDGDRIAFVSDKYWSANVSVMNADGSVQTRLTDTPLSSDDRSPAWAPP